MNEAQLLMKEAIAHVASHPELADFSEPASEASIEQASRLLGTIMPPSYRSFLSTYGAGDYNGWETYGVIEGNVEGGGIPSLVWLNRDLRAGQGWPSRYLVIAARGDGCWYCLDGATTDDAGEDPVVLCDPYGTSMRTVFPSFAAYFHHYVVEMP